MSKQAKKNKRKQGQSQAVVVYKPRGGGVGPRGSTTGECWLRLLADPCGAPLCRPCYTGTDSGFLLRTTTLYSIQYTNTGVAGAVTTSDGLYFFSPSNLSVNTGVVAGSGLGGSIFNAVSIGQNNFITTSGVVGSARAVAMCLRWLPNGAYNTRQGIVGLGYSPSIVFPESVGSSVATDVVNLLPTCLSYASNGTTDHQVRWLPTVLDESFSTQTSPNTQGVGTSFLVLAGVDGTQISTTAVRLNGLVEATTVWEWTPDNVYGTGVNIAIAPPPSETSQGVLSRIKNMTRMLVDGVTTVTEALRASEPSMRLLTAGMGTRRVMTGPSLLM